MNAEMNHEQETLVEPAGPESTPTPDETVVDVEPTYFGQVPEGEQFEMSNPNLKLAVIGLAILAASILGLSLIFASVDKTANDKAGGVSNVMAEQNRLMREAIEMAREAQSMNQQRMAEMHRAIEEAEGYADYAEFGDYAGAGADGYADGP